MGEFVEIVEVGPRDGLQNEARPIPTKDKVALIDALARAGFRRIEAGSFVSPKWVPQMADSADVLATIRRPPGTRFLALTPNMTGFDRAMAARADEIAVFLSASEGFSRANLNCSISESIERATPVIKAANAGNVPVRGYVSCVVECPYDGLTAPEDVRRVASGLKSLGCDEISLGDTIGRARPEQVDAMLQAVTAAIAASDLAGHFHDTGGLALANIDAALAHGIRIFDAAAGGLGGCPFAPGAAGNVATERVHAHLTALEFETGLDEVALNEAADLARSMKEGQVND